MRKDNNIIYRIRPLIQFKGLIFMPFKDRNLKFSILKIDFHNIKKSKQNIKILSRRQHKCLSKTNQSQE